jgi:hypothetical protein
MVPFPERAFVDFRGLGPVRLGTSSGRDERDDRSEAVIPGLISTARAVEIQARLLR